MVVASTSSTSSAGGITSYNVSVYAKTTSAFRVSAVRVDGTSVTQTITVNWIAIGA
jgi:hypothetical protein